MPRSFKSNSPDDTTPCYRVARARAGLGLFATVTIRRGERIVEYTGERITNDEADRRGGKYLFEINSKWTIDGKGRENIARYINHSCKPNAESRVVGVRVFIYAIRTIQPGEEIAYDYGEEYVEEHIEPHGCRCQSCVEKKYSRGPVRIQKNVYSRL